MERLTDCAQGYCEMYCKKYGHCFGDPGDCIFKDEIKLYEAVKSIEGIVPFDRLLELACADKAGRLVVLPCKVGDAVYVINRHLNRVFECTVISISIGRSTDLKNYIKTKWVGPNGNESIRKWSLRQVGKYVFMTREEAEAALAQKGGDG